MTAEQDQALREYLREAIMPLIEQVLVKKLGQAMSFAAQELIQPKREWRGLSADDWNRDKHSFDFQKGVDWAEAKLKEKNT